MRHRVKTKKLGRTASHRQATLNALATQLLKYKKIKTTSAKAKATKQFVEPLITKAKRNDLAAKRHVARFINDKEVFQELFTDIIEKLSDRLGGYTRVIKLGNRAGDAAEMSIIELVDYNEITSPKKKEKKAKTEADEPQAKKSKKAPAKEDAEEAKVVEEVDEKVDEAEEVKEDTEEPKAEEEPKQEVKEETSDEDKKAKENKAEKKESKKKDGDK